MEAEDSQANMAETHATRSDDLPNASAGPLGDGRFGFWAIFVVAGLVLLGHVAVYSFLCDDAFISFRYARNLANGDGLVFNPGHERVEGYTNFLWVLILAAGKLIGAVPEIAARPLSIAATIVLFYLVLRFCRDMSPAGVHPAWLAVPAGFLALNRSFAVWATGGLETRLFEVFIVAGLIATVREMNAATDNRRLPFSALLLALGTLTRPDGLLISCAILGVRLLVQLRRRRFRLQPMLIWMLVYGGIVGGHYLFRRFYYGDWLPNTYYAKVDGQTWWFEGAIYLATFAFEYAAILWLPLIVIGAWHLVGTGRSEVALLLFAAIIPHGAYVAAIGGDHFEYRPVDLYIPLIAVLLYFGAVAVKGPIAVRALAALYCAATILLGVLVPTLSHLSFPEDYRPGFPGLTPRTDQSRDLISRGQFPGFFRVPLLSEYLSAYNDLYIELSSHFVGLRQEEHAAFFQSVEQQGRRLAELVGDGRLPRDTHLAISCVGAIPYYSDLRVLDRLGLTDRVVARTPARETNWKIMAHQKSADREYVARTGVDFWSFDVVHPIVPAGHPALECAAILMARRGITTLAADLGDGQYLLVQPIKPAKEIASRFPGLNLIPASSLDGSSLDSNRRFTPVPREAQLGPPYDAQYLEQGFAMLAIGEKDAAMVQFQHALATNPANEAAADAIETLGQELDRGRQQSDNAAND
ncbi:hypothetical protein B7486_03305 [cyanobacterium TDX16]|nr:hypothetical protein B7486_03305 [cyanobacterium TDX16]